MDEAVGVPRERVGVAALVLRVEPLAVAHAALLFDDLREPSLYTFIPDEPPASLAALERRYKQLCAGAPPDRGETWWNWTMFDAADGRPIGALQATVYPGGRASIAYLVLVGRQREGLGRHGVTWLLDHLAAAGVTRAEAEVDVRNLASIRLLESLGFQRVGTHGDEHAYARALSI